MGGIRPDPVSDAELWEHLRAGGASEQDATTMVQRRQQLIGPVEYLPPAHGTSRDFGGPPVGHVEGASRAALQGATFGFGDEIKAGADAALAAGGAALRGQPAGAAFDRTYQRTVNQERDAIRDYRTEHPVAAFSAELAGGLAGGLGTGAAIRGLPGGARAVQAVQRLGQGSRLAGAAKVVGAGAAAGGLAGVGAATEGNRLRGAVSGAAFGGATAGVLGGTGKLLGGAVRPFLPLPASGTKAGAVVRAVGGQTAEDAALADVRKQLGRAHLTVDDLAAAAKTAHPDEMLLDLGGDAMVSRAGGAVATPSAGSVEIRRALQARGERMPVLAREATSQAVGRPRENATALAQDLIEQRRQAAAPLYTKAYSAPPVDDPDVLATLALPQFQEAHARAVRLAALDGVQLPPLTREVTVAGQKITEQVPQPVQSIDYVKRGLDDLIESKMRAGAMGRTEARALRQRLADMLGRVDDAVPDYKAARANFAGHSALMDAHEAGLNFLKETGDDLAAKWPTLSEGERDMYRRGALAAIEDKLKGRTDGLDATRLFRDDLMREKLRVILPSAEQASAFEQMVGRLHNMHGRANAILGNSKTAERLAQQSEAAGPGLGEMVGVATTGNPLPLAQYGVRAWLKQHQAGLTERQVDALAPLLTAKGAELEQVIEALRNMGTREVMRPRIAPTRTTAQVIGGRSQ